MKRLTTRADRLLIVFLALTSVMALVLLFWHSQSVAQTLEVSVQVDGKEIDRFSLKEAEGRSIRYKTDFGLNIVRVKDGKVSVAEADCPDKLCIKQGKISQPGQILVCLPNRFLVEMVGGAEQSSEVDVYLN